MLVRCDCCLFAKHEQQGRGAGAGLVARAGVLVRLARLPCAKNVFTAPGLGQLALQQIDLAVRVLEEFAWQSWRGEQLIKERFFYDPKQMAA